MIHKAQWIWSPMRQRKTDAYMCFRRSFLIREPVEAAKLEISADSDFVAWLNGREVARGQFSDFPADKTFGRYFIENAISAGTNVLAVLVYYRGEDFSDYMAGPPGLIARLTAGQTQIHSGDDWKVREHPSFRSGYRERMTPQCGFTFQFDARKLDDWHVSSYNDQSWDKAAIVRERSTGTHQGKLSLRPLPYLHLRPLRQGVAVMQGIVHRLEKHPSAAKAISASALQAEPAELIFETAEDGTLADETHPQAFQLKTPRKRTAKCDGRFFILDLGEETVGLLEFSISADAGTVIEIAHGEHLDIGRVSAKIGIRNFADRYICREGRQTFQMPFRRLGARYLEVHILGRKEILFHSIGLRPVEYPTESRGRFLCSDGLVGRIHEMGLRTLKLCRHEHYEDSPWREQSLYAYDARLQALYGYYAFGDYAFPAVSLNLLGDSYDSDTGLIALTAPSRVSVNIPIFSFVWIAAIAEHWMHSGDLRVFEKNHKQVTGILSKAKQRRDQRTGLYFAPEHTGCWHFYEWSPGLDGDIENGKLQGAHHAGYNLHLLEALRCYAEMLVRSGYGDARQEWEQIAALRKAIHRTFWDKDKGIYRSEIAGNGKMTGGHELIQAMAIGEGIPSRRAGERIWKSLRQESLVPCTLSSSFYLLRALNLASPSCDGVIRRKLSAHWEKMAFSGATTFWETAVGSRDFDLAGSMCHGWSALPVYSSFADVLGIRPLSPGFERFLVDVKRCGLRDAEGCIPTPHGDISLAWKVTDFGLRIRASGPRCCRPSVRMRSGEAIDRITYNGRSLS